MGIVVNFINSIRPSSKVKLEEEKKQETQTEELIDETQEYTCSSAASSAARSQALAQIRLNGEKKLRYPVAEKMPAAKETSRELTERYKKSGNLRRTTTLGKLGTGEFFPEADALPITKRYIDFRKESIATVLNTQRLFENCMRTGDMSNIEDENGNLLASFEKISTEPDRPYDEIAEKAYNDKIGKLNKQISELKKQIEKDSRKKGKKKPGPESVLKTEMELKDKEVLLEYYQQPENKPPKTCYKMTEYDPETGKKIAESALFDTRTSDEWEEVPGKGHWIGRPRLVRMSVNAKNGEDTYLEAEIAKKKSSIEGEYRLVPQILIYAKGVNEKNIANQFFSRRLFEDYESYRENYPCGNIDDDKKYDAPETEATSLIFDCGIDYPMSYCVLNDGLDIFDLKPVYYHQRHSAEY